MGTDSTPLALTRKNEYFIPKDGIAREVIEEDITRYLGNDATVRAGIQENPQTKEAQEGYYIDAYRNLTHAMLEDLRTDSEVLEAERLHSIPAADDNRSKCSCKNNNYYRGVPDAPLDVPVPTKFGWHVPRDLYESHCSQLDEQGVAQTREYSLEADSENSYGISASMATEREFEYPTTVPEAIPVNTNSSYSNDSYSSFTRCGYTTYDPKRPFLLSDGYGNDTPTLSDRKYRSVLNPELETLSDAGLTSYIPTHLKATECHMECCSIPTILRHSGTHISQDPHPGPNPLCGPVLEGPDTSQYVETLNTKIPVSSIETPSTGLYEATLSYPSPSLVESEIPTSTLDINSCSKPLNDTDKEINLFQAQYPNNASRETQKENIEPVRHPTRILWSSEPYPSFKMTHFEQHEYLHNEANPNAVGAQFSIPEAPPFPSLERSNPQSKTWADLPLVLYVPPVKKDIPVLLNGRYIRAHADFWISCSIINADFAKRIGATINFGTVCPPLRLPILNKYVQPVGVASISSKLPQEQGEGRMVDFIVIENFAHLAVIGRSLLPNSNEGSSHLSERPSRPGDIPICAFLGQGYQKLKCLVGDQEVIATADTGSDVNIMSFDFAARNGFNIHAITPPDGGHIRFSNSLVQCFNSLVSIPVSFGGEGPPLRLLKLADSTSISASRAQTTGDYAFGLPHAGGNVSILVNFLVLAGLAVDLILGEDVLATAREFGGVSADIFDGNSIASATFYGPGPMETVINTISGDAEVQSHRDESVKKQDMVEIVRYGKERERSRELSSKEKRRAERSNQKKRREYNKKRAEAGISSGLNTLHYHLCPCKLHSLD